ncbi:MAG: AraC family transcriptional regulator [Muribaculaceae bacterium]|nr:AraC family transcriptional regulator [Muribaculaceae bacterium]
MLNFTTEIWNKRNLPKRDNPIVVLDNVNSVPQFNFPLVTSSIWSIVCLKGEIRLTVDLKEHQLTPSSLMVMVPGHTISSYSCSADFEGFAINTTINSLESSLPLLSRILICYKVFNEDPILKISQTDLQNQILFRDLLRNKLAERKTTYNKLILGNLCEAITVETLSLYLRRLQPNAPASIKRTRAEELFYKFIVLIEDKFRYQRALSDYARDLCISTKHLSTLVKELSGRTASSWIDSYVILEAKQMLANTDLSIQEISEHLNFANQSFFGKFFKHNTGKSPTQFRKEKTL